MTTYRTATLGCKVNQYETREIEEVLERRGARPAAEGQAADLVIVNTCVVTAEAARQCRQIIRRQRRENPAAQLIVTGCYATGPEAGELARLDGVTLVAGDKADLRRRLDEALAATAGAAAPGEQRGISRFSGHTRAFVKIQDGCDQFCAYCIVPHARPRMVSTPAEQVVDEVRRLAAAGHREIVLSGIHLGRYGEDLGRRDALAALVAQLVAVAELGRVRLSSIEAGEVTPALLALMADHGDRLCPHLHLPLQSGDDGVLRAMRRPYGVAAFAAAVERVRAAVPRAALTTDVIVGFPGETDCAFERTCELVRQLGFSRLHVFPFSPRRGTPAADMAGQVPPEERRRRAQHLRRVGESLAAQFAAGLVGSEVTVLVERVRRRGADGFDEHYVRTRFACAADAPASRGDLVRVRTTAADGAMLVAEPVGNLKP